MNNEIKFIASMQDKASKQFRALNHQMKSMPTSITTRINYQVVSDIKQLILMGRWMDAINMKHRMFNNGQASVLNATKRNTSQMQVFAATVDKTMHRAVVSIKAVAAALQLLTVVGIAVAIAGLAIGFTIFAKKVVTLNSEFETFQTSLRTTLGSLAAAKKEMADIIEFARVTPYEIAGVTDAFVKLRAYALDPNVWATAAGDMAAAFGKPMIKAVEAIADATRGEFKRLREFGFVFHVNDFKQGGKQAGKTYAEAAFEAISGRFKGGMQLQAQTYAGIVSNLKDTITIAMMEAGKPVFELVKRNAKALLDTFDRLKSDGTIDSWVHKFQVGFVKAQEVVTNLISYIQSNWVPAMESIVSSVHKVGKVLLTSFGEPIFKSILSIVTVVVTLVAKILELVASSELLVKLITTLTLLKIGFKALGLAVAGSAASMVEAGTAMTLLGAKAYLMSKKIIGIGVAFAGIALVSRAIDYRNNIKLMAEETENSSNKMKKAIKKISDAYGLTRSETARAGVEAVKYGENWEQILKSAAKHADDMNASTESLVRTLGDLSEIFDLSGKDIEKMAKELQGMHKSSKGYKFEAMELANVLESYPELLKGSAEGWEEWIQFMEEAGKRSVKLTDDLGPDFFRELVAGMDLLRNPSLEMLIGGETLDGIEFPALNADAFITKSMEAAQSLSETRDQANSLEVALNGAWELLGHVPQGDYSQPLTEWQRIIATLRELDEQVKINTANQQKYRNEMNTLTATAEDAQDAQAYLNIELAQMGIELNNSEKFLVAFKAELAKVVDEIERIERIQPTGTVAFNDQINTLTDSILELELKSLRLDLEGVEKGFDKEQLAVDRLNSAIKAHEYSLKPLENRLNSMNDVFKDLSDSIGKAQKDLDKFTNPKLAGMGAFDDKLHSLDMQLNALERQRLDAAEGLKPFESLGLTDTDAYKRASTDLAAIDRKIDEVETQRSKIDLDKKLAYDDQLYQLGKIGDREKEITFKDAVAGAAAAAAQLDKLEPQLANVEKQKDALEAVVNTRQREIDMQKMSAELRQGELDIQKDILKDKKTTLDNDINRLNVIKNIAEKEYEIYTTQHKRNMEALANGPIEEDSIANIEAQYKRALEDKAFYEDLASKQESIVGDIKDRMAPKQEELALLSITLMENAQQQIETQRKLDDAENAIISLETTMKQIVGSLPSIITGVSIGAFMDSSNEALKSIFGEDYFKALETLLGKDSKNKFSILAWLKPNTTLFEGMFDAVSTKIGNFIDDHPWLTGGALVAGGTAAYKYGPGKIAKGAVSAVSKIGEALSPLYNNLLVENVPVLKKLAQETIEDLTTGAHGLLDQADNVIGQARFLENPNIRKGRLPKWLTGGAVKGAVGAIEGPGFGPLADDMVKALKGEFPASSLATKQIETFKEVADRLAKELRSNAGALVDNAEELANNADALTPNTGFWGELGTKLGKLLPRQFGEWRVGKMLNQVAPVDKQTAVNAATEAVDKIVKHPKIVRQVAGGVLSPFMINKPIKDMIEAAQGGGAGIPRFRKFNYAFNNFLGTASAAVEGNIVPRAGRLVAGRLSGRGLANMFRNEAGSASLEPIAKIVEPIQKLVQKVIGTKTSTVDMFLPNSMSGEHLKPFVKQFENQFGRVPKAREMLDIMMEKAGGGIKPAQFMVDAVNKVLKPVTTPGTGIKGMLEKAPGTMKAMGSTLKRYTTELPFGSIFDAIGDKIGSKGLGKVIGKGIGKALKYGLSAPVDIVTGSYDLQKLIRKIPGWDEAFASDSNPLTKMADAVRERMDPNTFLRMTEPIQQFGEAVGSLAEGLSSGIGDIIIGFFKGVWDMIHGEWNWDTLINGFKEVWEGLKGFFWGSIETWKAQWDAIPDTIKAPLINAWEWISSDDGPKGWAGKVWEFISNIGGSIEDAASGIMSYITSPFKAAWAWISNQTDGVASWPIRIYNFMVDIPNKLIGLKDALYNAGKNVIGWLVGGFVDKWNEVASTVERIHNAITGGRNSSTTNSSFAGAQASATTMEKVIRPFAYHGGGITPGLPSQEFVARLVGQEAVVPLDNGYIPVKISGGGSNGGSVTHVTVQSGAYQFTVRNDNDIEEIKEFLVDMSKNLTPHRDNPGQYNDRY